MIIVNNVRTTENQVKDLHINSKNQYNIVKEGLLALPAVIDPHVHFRTPGFEYKEDWQTGAIAALRGGVSQVFDMPNTNPPTITADLLSAKKSLIDSQLKTANIPLRYQLFFGADKSHLDELEKVVNQIVGIKVFMGCSTGNLVIDDDESLHAVFQLAAKHNLLVAVHAEDEHLIRENQARYQAIKEYAIHSTVRNIEVACTAVTKAITLAKQYNTRLYILHVSSAEEVALIKDAKAQKLAVYAETTPHHLFFDTNLYKTHGGRAVVNPPLRDGEHKDALWMAIRDGVIDTIGSDHAPHTLAEKLRSYGECPSGMPGIEFMLPLLITAYRQNMLTLDRLISLTSQRAREIFNLPNYEDWVLIDIEEPALVKETYSKCGWTPYQGMNLYGWPNYTILNEICFDLKRGQSGVTKRGHA